MANGFFKKTLAGISQNSNTVEKEELAEFELSVDEAKALKEKEELADDIPRLYGKLIHAVKRETKKEPRLIEELDKVIERPKRKPEQIIFDYEELVLEKPKTLKKSLQTLLGKKDDDDENGDINVEIQEIINSLATESSNSSATAAPVQQREYKLPDDSNRRSYIRAVINAIRKDPELRAAIEEANLDPRSVKKYFDALNDQNLEHPRDDSAEEITKIIYSDLGGGSLETAIERGLVIVQEFVADEDGKSTGIPFPKKPNKGK